jgi:hypothetical protein
MEDLSGPVETLAVDVTIPVPAYRCDHHVSGRAVLPAAEALQTLALTLPAAAGVTPLVQERAVFSHLLYIDPEGCARPAVHEFSRYADGRCLSRLVTIRTARQAGVKRHVEHASVWFLPATQAGERTETARALNVSASWPIQSFPRKRESGHLNGIMDSSFGGNDRKELFFSDMTAPAGGPDAAPALAGPVFTLSSLRLYAELVPFGPAYQNVTGEVSLTPAGAVARVSGGAFPGAGGPLGSPFPLDAALHVACAWGQRYRGLVAFPVGFERREIYRPTETGRTYRCSVVPLPEDNHAMLRADIRLCDEEQHLAEVICGIEMRDISGGRLVPPAWVREGA